jgi:hypothetical protein
MFWEIPFIAFWLLSPPLPPPDGMPFSVFRAPPPIPPRSMPSIIFPSTMPRFTSIPPPPMPPGGPPLIPPGAPPPIPPGAPPSIPPGGPPPIPPGAPPSIPPDGPPRFPLIGLTFALKLTTSPNFLPTLMSVHTFPLLTTSILATMTGDDFHFRILFILSGKSMSSLKPTGNFARLIPLRVPLADRL